jgi:hypothetical protein
MVRNTVHPEGYGDPSLSNVHSVLEAFGAYSFIKKMVFETLWAVSQ